MIFLSKNQIKIIRFITPYVEENGTALINLSYLAIYLKIDLPAIKRELHSMNSTLVRFKENKFTIISKLIIHLTYLNDGKLEVVFNKSILNYILDPSNQFEGPSMFKLKGSYKLYMALKDDSRSNLVYSFEELKNIFGSNYSLYGLFKFRVLSPAVNEIQEKTEKSISFSEIKNKTTRKVTSVEFFISPEMWDK